MNQHVPVADADAPAKRNAVVLACAQALGGSSPPIIISRGGIVGSQLVTDQTFATVPSSRACTEPSAPEARKVAVRYPAARSN